MKTTNVSLEKQFMKNNKRQLEKSKIVLGKRQTLVSTKSKTVLGEQQTLVQKNSL